MHSRSVHPLTLAKWLSLCIRQVISEIKVTAGKKLITIALSPYSASDNLNKTFKEEKVQKQDAANYITTNCPNSL